MFQSSQQVQTKGSSEVEGKFLFPYFQPNLTTSVVDRRRRQYKRRLHQHHRKQKQQQQQH